MTNKTDENRFRVFVYGTLKQGFHNHRFLTRNRAQFLGAAVTHDSYLMFDVGFPLIIDDHSSQPDAAPVAGEVYLVKRKCIKDLDRLEGEGVMYKKTKIKLHNDQDALAYIWIGEPEGEQVFPNKKGLINWRQ